MSSGSKKSGEAIKKRPAPAADTFKNAGESSKRKEGKAPSVGKKEAPASSGGKKRPSKAGSTQGDEIAKKKTKPQPDPPTKKSQQAKNSTKTLPTKKEKTKPAILQKNKKKAAPPPSEDEDESEDEDVEQSSEEDDDDVDGGDNLLRVDPADESGADGDESGEEDDAAGADTDAVEDEEDDAPQQPASKKSKSGGGGSGATAVTDEVEVVDQFISIREDCARSRYCASAFFVHEAEERFKIEKCERRVDVLRVVCITDVVVRANDLIKTHICILPVKGCRAVVEPGHRLVARHLSIYPLTLTAERPCYVRFYLFGQNAEPNYHNAVTLKRGECFARFRCERVEDCHMFECRTLDELKLWNNATLEKTVHGHMIGSLYDETCPFATDAVFE